MDVGPGKTYTAFLFIADPVVGAEVVLESGLGVFVWCGHGVDVYM